MQRLQLLAVISTPSIIANPNEQVVMKSVDGGKTWVKAGGFNIVAKDNGCKSSEYILWGDDGVVAPDGSIYIGILW